MDLEFGYGDLPDHMIPIRNAPGHVIPLRDVNLGLKLDLIRLIDEFGLAGVKAVVEAIEKESFRVD